MLASRVICVFSVHVIVCAVEGRRRRAKRRIDPRDVPTTDSTRRVRMAYVDGFVLAVPTASKEVFIEHARKADAVFMPVVTLPD